MKGRKIKHYRSGYLMRKRRRERFLKTVFFLFIIALLVFLGYTIATSVSNRKVEKPLPEPSVISEELSEEPIVSEVSE